MSRQDDSDALHRSHRRRVNPSATNEKNGSPGSIKPVFVLLKSLLSAKKPGQELLRLRLFVLDDGRPRANCVITCPALSGVSTVELDRQGERRSPSLAGLTARRCGALAEYPWRSRRAPPRGRARGSRGIGLARTTAVVLDSKGPRAAVRDDGTRRRARPDTAYAVAHALSTAVAREARSRPLRRRRVERPIT